MSPVPDFFFLLHNIRVIVIRLDTILFSVAENEKNYTTEGSVSTI